MSRHEQARARGPEQVQGREEENSLENARENGHDIEVSPGKSRTVVIVGGVAGGASTAARLRRVDEFAEIIIFERGPHVSFANCGLPYYVGREITDREALELVTPEKFRDRFAVTVHVRHEVVRIDRAARRVVVRDLEAGREFEQPYDALVLAPGAAPVVPPFPGLDQVPHFTLRDIPDMEAIDAFLAEHAPRRAVVVGGGFIGLEMVENLVSRGLEVAVVELTDQVMAPLDREMAQFVHQELVLNGVQLVLNDGVEAIRRLPGSETRVVTQSGRELPADLVVVAVGVRPDTALARAAGLALDARGHILVDEAMRTSDPAIWAVGDAVTTPHRLTGDRTPLYLAGPANREGRVAADNIADHRPAIFPGVVGTSVVKVFDLVVASTGLNEKTLQAREWAYERVYLHPNNHVGYYPGATTLSTKLLFSKPEGRVLGVQVVGGPGADKRVDVIATVIAFGGTVFDLERLELAYAPPFGSAKDPVNMAGFIAANHLRGDITLWHWDEVADVQERGEFILDVRNAEEFEAGHLQGAHHLPDGEVRARLAELPDKQTPVYVHCEVGFRGYLVTRILLQRGWKHARNLAGGYKTWHVATTPADALAAESWPELLAVPPGLARVPPEDVEAMPDVIEVDARGLACPGPLRALINTAKRMPIRGLARVVATDPGFPASVVSWTKLASGVALRSLRRRSGAYEAVINKTGELGGLPVDATGAGSEQGLESPLESALEPSPRSAREGAIRPAGVPPASTITVDELCERVQEDRGPALILDVRQEAEFHGPMGHIPGAVLLPLGELANRVDEIRAHARAEVVTVCQVGLRSMLAARLLVDAGFEYVRSLAGGMLAWRTEKCLPVERG